jgi:hypothetical protein
MGTSPLAGEARVRPQAAEAPLQPHVHRDRGRAEVERLGQPGAQGVEPLARVHAEHGAQDDLERQRLKACVQRRDGGSG